MIVVLVVSFVLGAVAWADQLRRPESRWLAAGRDRGWWTGITAALTLLGLGALPALAYAVLALPRLVRRPDPPPQPRPSSGRIVVSFDD